MPAVPTTTRSLLSASSATEEKISAREPDPALSDVSVVFVALAVVASGDGGAVAACREGQDGSSHQSHKPAPA